MRFLEAHLLELIGSALATFGAELKAVLQTHAEVYTQTLEQHFSRRLIPFAVLSKA